MSLTLIAKNVTPPNGGYLCHQHSNKNSALLMLAGDFGA